MRIGESGGKPMVRGGYRPGSGRKAVPWSKRKSEGIFLALTPAQNRRYSREAERRRMKIHDWMRFVLDQSVRRRLRSRSTAKRGSPNS